MTDTEGESAARRILVVEDSVIIALDTEECLLGLGAAAVEVQATVAGALAALDRDRFDLVLLDFDLGGESGDPVAEVLRLRGIPFWLATGYNEMADKLDETGARGLLLKPYGKAELVNIMQQFAGNDAQGTGG